MSLTPLRAVETPDNNDQEIEADNLSGGVANESDAAHENARPLTIVPKDEQQPGPYDHIRVLSTDPLILDGEPLITEVEEQPRKGFFSRLYNSVASRIPPKEVLFNRDRLKDLAAGAAVSGAVRYAVMGAGTAVGVTGIPIVLGSAVAASVARTVWNIHKDRKAYMAETGENISFLSWTTKKDVDADGNVTRNNVKKYVGSLAMSTMFAGAGAAFMTYVAPNIEQWAAPVVDRIKDSQAFGAVSGFLAGIWSKISPPSVDIKPTPKLDPEAAARAREALEKLLPPKTPPAQSMMSPEAIQRRIEEAHAVAAPPAAAAVDPTKMSPDAIQRRIEDAHAAAAPSTVAAAPVDPTKMSGEAIQRRIEEAHAAVARPSLVDAPAPVISVSDRISLLTQDHHFSKRWQGIIDHALKGDAQAQKDIAKAVLNGTNGFEKNPAQAAEIYRAAAAAGNTQAKVDLAYMQFHGLGGIQADSKAALEALREQAGGNKYARSMLHHLSGGETAHKTASAALKQAASADTAEIKVAAAPVSAASANVPEGATLKVTWRQTADGAIEGVVNKADVPGWLKEGMQVSFPTADIK